MKHLGDITKINGYDVPIVDIVTGGSPCQDLSVAGKRAGLDGERSGLFMEQIRIIKEMREYDKRTNTRSDVDVRPRYMVWENVPGAFSSNKGDDFRCVLEETAKIADENASIPRPEGGAWSKAGCVVGDGWSLAWRVHDAQFWGVPQRRKRICLLADFNGDSAPKILFELFGETIEGDGDKAVMGIGKEPRSEVQPLSESLRGNSEEGKQEGQAASRDVGEGIDSAITYRKTSHAKSAEDGQGWTETEINDTLNIFDNGEVRTPTIIPENHPADSRVKICEDDIFQTLSSRMGTGGGNVPMVMEQNCIYSIGHDIRSSRFTPDEITDPLTATDYKDPIKVFTAEVFHCTSEEEKVQTLKARDYKDPQIVVNPQSIVRRLTPLECERLQGYPDQWTNIGEWTDSKGKKRKDSDSPRYKALGNSIALPFWRWLAERIVSEYDRQTTMASLFDGIGGFPLVFSQFGCKPLWASEIEDFPVAVTKIRFAEDTK